ncbi:methylase [Lactococcus phage 1W08F]|uniref:site-specific DNA-methyltransferase (adenine-specific) n=1 Tax=Lactococcus phage 936 group phage Phi5.12 TaxID=1636570 RepID=A0A126HA09_9CAUD|nr:methylase [Lactococcus phage 936 group phage Phi5.12]ALM63434.1 methylase [Lactococcus phage 936 group phage Phi5.12]QBQ81753.1 methylase [Lactococcus phage 1W08F]
MLNLDEKKIRKSRPIGLPYQGSKKKISKKIVEIIKQNFGTDKPIYDIFGGGGAITAECILNGLEVHYNDLDKDITNAFERVISQDREWIKTLIVSRTEFTEIKAKENKTTDDFLKLLVNSFGNNKKGYMYSKEISDLKYNLAKEIIGNHDVFGGYKQTETYKKVISGAEWNWFNKKKDQSLEQLQQLQRLEQLNEIKVTNKSYRDFSEVSGAILYLDPPYEGTTHDGYKGKKQKRTVKPEVYKEMRDKLLKLEKGTKIEHDSFIFSLGFDDNNKNRMYYKDVSSAFDSQEFYDWAFEMAKTNIVIISSYSISDERFEVVYSFDKARSTLQSGTRNDECEKLFMVKNS